MSGDVVNLNKARKARAKQAARAGAEANRVRFGRSKEERAAAAEDQRRAERTLDEHRLDRPPGASQGKAEDES